MANRIQVKVDEAARMLHISIPITGPVPSKAGKTILVATSRGNQTTEALFQGKAIVVGVNAYVYPNER